MQYEKTCCIRSFFFLFCPCKSLSNPCFPPLRDMSRPRKKRHKSLGKLQFSPIILSFQLLITGGKSPYFSLRDSDGKRIGSRKGPATFLNYSKLFSAFSYQFLLFLWSYLAFSTYFREKKENEIWKKKEPYRASQSLIAASFDSSYDTRKNEMGARSEEGNWQEMIGWFERKRRKRRKNPYPKSCRKL